MPRLRHNPLPWISANTDYGVNSGPDGTVKSSRRWITSSPLEWITFRTLQTPSAFIAYSLRARRAARCLQFLLNDELDRAANSRLQQPASLSLPSAPPISHHSVILQYPPASGCELWLNSPDLNAFLLFHLLLDTALPPFGRKCHPCVRYDV